MTEKKKGFFKKAYTLATSQKAKKTYKMIGTGATRVARYVEDTGKGVDRAIGLKRPRRQVRRGPTKSMRFGLRRKFGTY